MKEDIEETKIMPLNETMPMPGWYCPHCEMFHPRNMTCGPETLFWDEKKKDYIAMGQKLAYFQ